MVTSLTSPPSLRGQMSRGGGLEGGCGQLLPRSQPGALSTGGGGDEVGSHQIYSMEKVCAGWGGGGNGGVHCACALVPLVSTGRIAKPLDN